MELRALMTAAGQEMSLADLRLQIEATGFAIEDLVARISDSGGLVFVHTDDIDDGIPVVEIFDEASDNHPDLSESDILIYVGTDDEGDDILCMAPRGKMHPIAPH